MGSKKYDIVVVSDVILLDRSGKAGIFQRQCGEVFCVPWSQVKGGTAVESYDSGNIRIPRWLAEAKHLNYSK